MCYAIPGRIVAVDSGIATLSYFGELRKARSELETLEPGQYVYAQGGYIIEVLSSRAAEDVLDVWKNSYFSLREEDLRRSSISVSNGVSEAAAIVLKKASLGVALNDKEAVYLIGLNGELEQELMFETANFLRSRYQGNGCCVHGVLEFSNYCIRNCCYCGLSSTNESLYRYRMSAEEIEDAVVDAIDRFGFKVFVLQCGDEGDKSVELLEEAIRRIRDKRSVLLIVSPGEVSKDGLDRLYNAGARGLLLRFETSDPKLYQELHPGYPLKKRLEVLYWAQEIGFFLITGSLVGLPGQTMESLVQDIRLAADTCGAAMFSFGPFIPHPQTPLSSCQRCDESLMLKVLALIRILYPEQGGSAYNNSFRDLTS